VAGSGGEYACKVKDVNRDSLADLQCDIETWEVLLQPGEDTMVLNAPTYDGYLRIEGSDHIIIVKPN
jgi:hypothetical protein